MNNLMFTVSEFALKAAPFFVANEGDDGWAKFNEVIKQLLPILWIASALVSTFWLIFRLIKTTHKGGEADDQGDYQKYKAARKRALIAWLFGLCWPVILMLVWPLVPVIGKAFGWADYMKWPSLF